MRIVAGTFGGRQILSPGDRSIRPTTDRVREAIFSVIAARVPGGRVLDLFAGTGALGLEALSRGAAEAVFVDGSPAAIRLIRSNIERCNTGDRARVLSAPAARALRRLAEAGDCFDLIFLDPPYGKGLIPETLKGLEAVAAPECLVVAEHDSKEDPPERVGPWGRTQRRKYGDTAVSLFTLIVPAHDRLLDSQSAKE